MNMFVCILSKNQSLGSSELHNHKLAVTFFTKSQSRRVVLSRQQEETIKRMPEVQRGHEKWQTEW